MYQLQDTNQVPIRFRQGFYRKPESSIGILSQRKENQLELERRAILNDEFRKQNIHDHSSKNGNVMIGGDALTVLVY